MSDLIDRQAAIDIERNATVDTNPSHFEAHQKFTQFMDDAEISSFGRWQWSNGFNTALTAVGIDLKKLPSAQPEPIKINIEDFNKEDWERFRKEWANTPITVLSAQPKRGKWIRHTRVEPVYSIDGVETWGIKCQCNKCCFTTTVVEDFGYYNFCPHCGADMRGDNNED